MRKILSFLISFTFILQLLLPPSYAQLAADLPKPGVMVSVSSAFNPAQLKGIIIDPKEPFKFDFLISRGDQALPQAEKKEAYAGLVKYFLASLAVPEQDQWVNLSPYENNRIIDESFGMTGMGRDLLSQDYILKQITASLIYPDDELGKKFWNGVYQKAHEAFGTTDIPVNTFNKVWIMPDEAVILEKGKTALILKTHLKVMLEQDYVALRHDASNSVLGTDQLPLNDVSEASKISSDVVRQVILPAIEREVNEGKNFAGLRQVVSGMVLAAWFKKALKESVLGKVYADQRKVKGVDQSPSNNQAVYERYLEAYKKGAFNMIREDIDMYSQEIIPRKYFSGGFNPAMTAHLKVVGSASLAEVNSAMDGLDKAAVVLKDFAQGVSATEAERILTLFPGEKVWVTESVEEDARGALLTQVQVKDGLMAGSIRVDREKLIGYYLLQTTLKRQSEVLVQEPAIKKALLPDDVRMGIEGVDAWIKSLFKEGVREIEVWQSPRRQSDQVVLPGQFELVTRNQLENYLNMENPIVFPVVINGQKQFISKIAFQKLLRIQPVFLQNQVPVRIENIKRLELAVGTKKNVLMVLTSKPESRQVIVTFQTRDEQGRVSFESAPLAVLSEENDDRRSVILGRSMLPTFDPLVSRQHAKVKLESFDSGTGTFTVSVEDNKSTNGTWAQAYDAGQAAVDNAGVLDKTYGGIDLNASNLNMKIKRDGGGMPLPVSLQDLSAFKINGLVPVIVKIEPVAALPELQ